MKFFLVITQEEETIQHKPSTFENPGFDKKNFNGAGAQSCEK